MAEAIKTSEDKRTALDLIGRLPDDVDTEDIIEELYFKLRSIVA
jgi:hypothetical protein